MALCVCAGDDPRSAGSWRSAAEGKQTGSRRSARRNGWLVVLFTTAPQARPADSDTDSFIQDVHLK